MTAQHKPRAGRRPGNQDTRGLIVSAAREGFAARGFAGTSMRAIAADAGVDASLIHHYFATKQQLFLATTALPVNLPAVLDEAIDHGYVGLGERLVRTVLGLWDSDLQPALVAATRTMLTEPGMTRSLSEFLTLEVIDRVLRGLDLAPSEANRRAGLVASQMVGLVVGRYLLQLPALTSRSAEELVAEIGPTMQRYLDGS